MQLQNEFIQYAVLIQSMSLELLSEKISRESYLDNLERMISGMKKCIDSDRDIQPKKK